MDNQIQQATPEDIKVAKLNKEIEKNYTLTPKYKLWESYYLDSKLDTFGNATLSAIKAYNLDPETQYYTAGRMGHDNTKKHKDLAKRFYEKSGKSHKDVYNILWNMMLAKKDVDLVFYFGELLGANLPGYKPTTNPTYIAKQENNQFNIGGDMSLSFIKEEDKVNASETNGSSVSDSNGQPQV